MSGRRPIRRVLIANRGEIAVRIARSLQELGIEVIAVHSEADRGSLHLRYATEATLIGPAPARESYLSIPALLAAATRAKADAIHPGYGFLSENAAFAQACEDQGFIFIGPTAAAIQALGDKARARELAEKAGLPVTPGRRDVADQDMEAAAKAVGYPLLLKPAAGGGGKGMHRVLAPAALQEAVAAARREAAAAFGDDRLLVERWVHPARHIEIQVFGDGEGEVVALGERECSLQRRHQKVIEECPSPVVGQALRERMCRAAIDLATRVRYRGAGTVEFLLGPDDSVYFLEMNTRLQVEHPVTELVYGVDLVKAQLAVAAGEGIPPALHAATRRGHAIEARLYAEDPSRGFLPSPGRVLAFLSPSGPGVRVDAGIDREGEVGPWYDPMVAKIVVWGIDRADATAKMIRALRETALVGPASNLDFLRAMAGKDWFAAGDFHTRTIEERIAAGESFTILPAEPPPDVLALAARELMRAGRGPAGAGSAAGGRAPDLFTQVGAWMPAAGEPA